MTPILRAVPPADAPLSPAALAGGLAAALGIGEARERGVRDRLSRLFPADRAILLDSGTSALALALRWTGLDRPGPVAMPAYCCYDVVTAAEVADAELLYYDLDPRTLQPDPDSLGRAVGRGATRVVIAHLFGIPVDPRPLLPVVGREGALLIEDAAQGFGALVDGSPAGALSEVSILSFNRGKGVTGGGGGALLSRGGAAASWPPDPSPGTSPPRGWRELGIAATTWALARPSLYGLPLSLPFLRLGETRYRPPRPVRAMSRAAAGVLDRSIPLAERAVEGRRARAAALAGLLRGRPDVHVISPLPGCEGGFLRLPVLLSGGARAKADGGSRAGIAPAYPGILADLDSGRRRSLNPEGPFPGARELADSLYTLPTHGRSGGWGERALRGWIRGLG